MSKLELKKINLKNIDKRQIFLIGIGALCIIIALVSLINIFSDYKKSDDTYKKAEEQFVQIKVENSDSPSEEKVPWYEMISVDIAGLKQINPEVVGWIFFEDGAISYPVLQASDNDKYLYTTYDGQYAKAGSIFVEATHKGDFSETHTLIYGHNMKNLSMFSRLKYYKMKSGHYEGREYFQIHKGDEILRYQIFAYKDVGVDSFVYREYFTSARDLSLRMLEGSMINPQLNIEDDDKIITLSTCTSDDDRRFVVSAVLIERYSLTDKVLTEELHKE